MRIFFTIMLMASISQISNAQLLSDDEEFRLERPIENYIKDHPKEEYLKKHVLFFPQDILHKSNHINLKRYECITFIDTYFSFRSHNLIHLEMVNYKNKKISLCDFRFQPRLESIIISNNFNICSGKITESINNLPRLRSISIASNIKGQVSMTSFLNRGIDLLELSADTLDFTGVKKVSTKILRLSSEHYCNFNWRSFVGNSYNYFGMTGNVPNVINLINNIDSISILHLSADSIKDSIINHIVNYKGYNKKKVIDLKTFYYHDEYKEYCLKLFGKDYFKNNELIIRGNEINLANVKRFENDFKLLYSIGLDISVYIPDSIISKENSEGWIIISGLK